MGMGLWVCRGVGNLTIEFNPGKQIEQIEKTVAIRSDARKLFDKLLDTFVHPTKEDRRI